MYSRFVMLLCNIIIFHKIFYCLWAIPFVFLYLLLNTMFCLIYNVHDLLGSAFVVNHKVQYGLLFTTVYLFFLLKHGV